LQDLPGKDIMTSRQRIEALGPGGFVICTAHNPQADTPLSNVEALFEAYRDIGRY